MAFEGRHVTLTPTQRCSVLRLVAGWDPKRIAAWRGVSLKTVENQIHSIHLRLGVSRTRPDVVERAIEHMDCCIRPWEFPEV